MTKQPLNFALIGAAGYIAPRHLKAIRETGNNLVAALDPFDSVGILDSFFPDCRFFTEFEQFECHVDGLKETEKKVGFVSICSPNYLHSAHIRFGLRHGCDVICEKPSVLEPGDLDLLGKLAAGSGKKVYNILQLRLHPVIISLKEKIENEESSRIHDIDLTYITSRGNWYHASWKGDTAKSGGVATNIGVHFYDMLCWIFGEPSLSIVHRADQEKVSGYLEFRKARVRYFLSINYDSIPENIRMTGKRTYRSLKMDGEEVEFSEGFTDLHTESYRQILDGKGYTLEETRQAIEIVYRIRNSRPVGLTGDWHPLAAL